MARYKVILAYDGTGFSGFQRQKNARTIQAELEAVLRALGWQGTTLAAAGRTDSGVHALGQVIAFDLEWRHSEADLLNAMNARLSQDISVRSIETVKPDFHPRYSAIARIYRYSLFCDPVRQPLRERYSWRVWPPVQIAELEDAARLLIGTHDFKSFGSAPHKKGSTIRQVRTAYWRQSDDEFLFEIEANAFLHRMVRRLVAVQIMVGQGRLELEEMKSYLDEPRDRPIQGLAPPHGLTLYKVIYDNL